MVSVSHGSERIQSSWASAEDWGELGWEDRHRRGPHYPMSWGPRLNKTETRGTPAFSLSASRLGVKGDPLSESCYHGSSTTLGCTLECEPQNPSFPETAFAVSVRKAGYRDKRRKRQPLVARQPQLDRQRRFAVVYKQPTPFYTPAPENLVTTMDEAKDKGTLELLLNSDKT